jgi:hypothetical protein
MRYAYVNGIKREAEPKLHGICPVCGKEVIARCPKEKVNHWMHKPNSECDKWWEAETAWHRMWKDYFPKEWQEVVMHDEETGEKHIADVRTENGITIEFQHSFMKEEERISREKFYDNLLWVVDGTRLASDLERFKFATIKKFNNDFAYTSNPERVFPKNWLNSDVPVFFDFCAHNIDHNLFCLMPGRVDGKAAIYITSKTKFLAQLKVGKVFDADPKEYVKVLCEELEKLEKIKRSTISNRGPIRRSRRF